MAVHLEFVVAGTPISNQSPGPNLAAWRSAVAGAAGAQWLNPPLKQELKAVIINFYAGAGPTLDVDNLSKPILDSLQTIVYDNDRQIVQAELAHVRIAAAFSIV